jgi:predicted outer membrane lipoprotein
MAWWYFAIALGFALLAINRAIVGEKAWLIGVRVVIALGFGALAAMEFNTKDGRR